MEGKSCILELKWESWSWRYIRLRTSEKYQVISKFLTQAAKDNGIRDRDPDWRIKNLTLVTFSSNCWTPRSGQRSSLDRFRSLGWRYETLQRMEFEELYRDSL